jgi:hypothetical protein
MKELIQKEINDHIKTLNSEDFEHYRREIDTNEDRQDETVAELVASADIDSVDFNIGFEQGYMRGLEVALSILNK